MILISRCQGEAEGVNVRQIAIIGAALFIAGGAFLWMRGQANNAARTAAPVAAPIVPKAELKLTKVLVAKRDMAIGDTVTAESMGWVDWPSTSVSTSFLTQTGNKTALEDYKDAIVRIPVASGEPITPAKIVRPNGPVSSVAALITPGMRATTVPINVEGGVSGFVLPNSKVDVILTRSLTVQSGGNNVSRSVASTILENVKVLAIDQNLTAAKDQKAMTGGTATLELSPQDAERLKTADSLGDISLVLRGYADSEGPTIARGDALAMMQPNLPKVNAKAGPPSNANPEDASKSVKVYRGGQ